LQLLFEDEHLVPMDFTGSTGRIISDPKEAMRVANRDPKWYMAKTSTVAPSPPKAESRTFSSRHSMEQQPRHGSPYSREVTTDYDDDDDDDDSTLMLTQPWYLGTCSREFIKKYFGNNLIPG
jgi:hypothetical protein